jgi:IS30 family transposase
VRKTEPHLSDPHFFQDVKKLGKCEFSIVETRFIASLDLAICAKEGFLRRDKSRLYGWILITSATGTSVLKLSTYQEPNLKRTCRMNHYTRITFKERRQITTFIQMGLSVAEMSRQLKRARSTIYREVKRNSLIDGYYVPGHAQEQMNERRPHKKHKIDGDEFLKEYVIKGLECGWSPEQISGRLRHEHPKRAVCLETIYRYIYRQRQEKLYKFLLRQKVKRIKTQARINHRQMLYMQDRNIKNRSDKARAREVYGHWEGDTIRFERNQKACVTTLVERKSRMMLIAKNANGKSKIVMNKIKQLMEDLPRKFRKSVTFDLGSEFMNFRIIEKEICPVYYCDPRKPWQRPSNENTNGRLRRYLPKDCHIDQIEESTLVKIQDSMNNTPRKCLNFLTPYEVLGQYKKYPCRTKT